ncbi:nuclear transport factor 2 family protein [Dyella jejuensis]|uniref:Nuclear transport factor 2 family protein n=1 Tax=Dyella jejuensis TaxID=1432009 RepID=A0ABW8JKF2_9GAMM
MVQANHNDAIHDAGRIDALIRRYFQACNDADVQGMLGCFTSDAVHYFPPGMYEGPFRGAQKIAERWRQAVHTLGSYWTVDRLLIEPASLQAVMEWTHFKTKQDKLLRGIEWYELDGKSGLIKEIRAYYATPQPADGDRFELGGFDYVGREYPSAPPAGARPSSDSAKTGDRL